MANFSKTYKLKLTLALIWLLLSGFATEIEQSKTLMIQGNRKAAIELLDKAISKLKSPKEIAALADKRKLYLDQFISSEAFQLYQEAKLMNQADRFNDCVRELDKVALADQDGKQVLILRAQCLRGQNQMNAAEKILVQLAALDATDESVILDYIDLELSMNQLENAYQLIQKSQINKDSERFSVLKSKYFVLSNRTKEAIDVLRNDQEKIWIMCT